MSQQRMEEILGTALDLFSRYGFHGTSMRDIGEAVGLDKSSLYNYLESKEELLRKLLTGHLDRYFGGGFKALEDLSDPREAIGRLVDHVVDMGLTDWRYTVLFVREQASLPADLNQAISQRNNELRERIHQAIEAGVDVGQFRRDADKEFTALAILGLGYSIHSWAANDPNVELERLQVAYRELILRGLSGAMPDAPRVRH
ncbi:MAG: TetR/AcrR family transcriptional regulator [Myxococcota bacterium]